MTYHELRQQQYEKIVDEAIYISRASEGSISSDWVMEQPIFIRKKYYKQLREEIEKREEKINRRKMGTSKKGGPSYSKNRRSVNPEDIVTSNDS